MEPLVARSFVYGHRAIPKLPQALRVSSYCRGFTSSVPKRDKVDDFPARKWSTPLAAQLNEAISATGPIPLASYMRMCLTSDTGGYYTGALESNRDQFGRKGDFITSPEISQVFGELVGLWFVAEWMSQGRPSCGVELVEVGPGRGTLMDDILRTMRNFKDMISSIDAVYMVETSAELRQAQKNLLCGKDAPMRESKGGFHSTSKCGEIPIVWTESVKSIPRDSSRMPFIVAHEFFDALPIHAFQVVEVLPSQDPSPTRSASSNVAKPTLQWREMIVSPTSDDVTHDELRTPKSERHGPPPEFQLTLAPMSTRHAVNLPDLSPRYRALKNIPNALIEVCPDAHMHASEIATRIGGSASNPKSRPSGAALVIDYGPSDTIPINSLRGIKAHRRVGPFSEPGLVDLSADVDFSALAEAATRASEGVEVHGPVTQADFLGSMGVRQRVEILARKSGDPKRSEEIMSACNRLVDRGPGGMGKIYKALAIVPENGGQRRPVGFGGDVSDA